MGRGEVRCLDNHTPELNLRHPPTPSPAWNIGSRRRPRRQVYSPRRAGPAFGNGLVAAMVMMPEASGRREGGEEEEAVKERTGTHDKNSQSRRGRPRNHGRRKARGVPCAIRQKQPVLTVHLEKSSNNDFYSSPEARRRRFCSKGRKNCKKRRPIQTSSRETRKSLLGLH